MKKPAVRPILDVAQKPAWAIGMMVHYTEPDGTDDGIHRPALVNWDFTGKRFVLTVIHPQRVYSVDLEPGLGRTPAPHDQEGKMPHSWHYPEEQ